MPPFADGFEPREILLLPVYHDHDTRDIPQKSRPHIPLKAQPSHGISRPYRKKARSYPHQPFPANLEQSLLDRKDRMCMACGLAARVPFCDYRIVEYLYGVPWEFKDYRNTEKGLLRYAMEGLLPDAVLWRKKSPYPKTHDPSYLDCVSSMLRKVLNEQSAPIFNIVDKKALIDLLEHDFNKPWYGQLMQQPQTIAYMLQINFWLEHYNIQMV